ncbi:MAG: site-specific DNA-methyltransferase, partial [Dehalococcoidales bacterium]|nr:site-specific DNA-methyltransferase [Dehalococcoidales bacterium]
MTNALFYGDNLIWLRDRKYFPDESVDLIYLDPPFNSKADYNVMFNETAKGDKSQAQIKAFDDTWHWDSEASETALYDLAQNKPQIAELISWLNRQGKSNESMAAYLSMMAIRLTELHRVLAPTGSLYLHCDPTASHYLKLILDSIFGIKNYLNEIVWCYREREITKRYWNRKHDVILFYAKDVNNANRIFNWNEGALSYSPGTAHKYNLVDNNGRKYQIRGKGGEYIGEQQLSTQVELEHPEWTYRDYWDKKEGIPPRDWLAPPMENVECPQCKSIFRPEYQYDWLNRASRERLGYPTQKPLSILELIINVSSNKGDIVLDPFCGCGTTIDVAQKLQRHWKGIDVTWLAVDLVEK